MTQPTRSLLGRLTFACVSLAFLAGCGDGSDDLGATDDSQAASQVGASEQPVPATRAGEVSEVSYAVSGAVSESHEEEGNVMCSTTTQGEFLARNFGGEWTVSLRVAGTDAGTHDASLELGPPDRDGLREGDWRRDLRGTVRGQVTLSDTGEKDGYGNSVMEAAFDFPEVTLERSQAVLGIAGTFRCGVLGQG